MMGAILDRELPSRGSIMNGNLSIEKPKLIAGINLEQFWNILETRKARGRVMGELSGNFGGLPHALHLLVQPLMSAPGKVQVEKREECTPAFPEGQNLRPRKQASHLVPRTLALKETVSTEQGPYSCSDEKGLPPTPRSLRTSPRRPRGHFPFRRNEDEWCEGCWEFKIGTIAGCGDTCL